MTRLPDPPTPAADSLDAADALDALFRHTTRRRLMQSAGLGLAGAALASPLAALAAAPRRRTGATSVRTPPPAALKKYSVTVRRFDPARGLDSGEEFVLPVDCIDEEHAVSAVLSNAIAFTPKTASAGLLPVAFACTGVRERTDA